MKQCLLGKGNRRIVAWLPVKFATRRKYLRLFDEDGWQVLKVWPLYVADVDLPHGYFAGGVSH